MKEEMIGKQFTTNKSGVCVITKYVGCNEVYVKFLDTGFERVTDMNSLCKPNVNRTDLPRGVSLFGSKSKPYSVSIRFDGVSKNLGYYTTLEEASLVSKEARLNRVKFLEDKYKNTVESKVFDELRKDKWIL